MHINLEMLKFRRRSGFMTQWTSRSVTKYGIVIAWWRHQMETFFALQAFYAGNSTVTGGFSSQRTVTRGFNVFFDLRLNKQLSKQSWGWRFETSPHSLWRHCNGALYDNMRCVSVGQPFHKRGCYLTLIKAGVALIRWYLHQINWNKSLI